MVEVNNDGVKIPKSDNILFQDYYPQTAYFH